MYCNVEGGYNDMELVQIIMNLMQVYIQISFGTALSDDETQTILQ